jgi:ankyrin repeat protein
MENSQRGFELIGAGDTEGLRRYLDENPDSAKACDTAGVSLLMDALYHGKRELAEMIAAKKMVLDIFEAASLGHLDQLTACLRIAAAVNSPSKDGFTALHFACYFGQADAVLLLLGSGAAVDSVAANPTRVMPLHSAASARNVAAARLLLEHGAPVNARQNGGWAPIHAAAQNGDEAMAELLLKHGADSEVVNDDGKTPAMIARQKGHETVAVLMERAA